MKQLVRVLYLVIPKSDSGNLEKYWSEFIAFGFKQALSCIFPAFIFCMLVVSNLTTIPFLPRYDFLLIACVVMQAIMYFSKLESGMELLVITMFHVLGLIMEIYKVSMHSWSYPEFAYTKIYGVPLYSGFMYASVGSYVCQAWRWCSLKIINWPEFIPATLVSIGIYVNFFTHHYAYDFRWVLTLLLIIIFWKTKVIFTTNNIKRKMPLVLSFLLIGFFIWVAENMATYLGAWKYATQHEGWKMVSLGKISSWFLLIVLSIVIVIQLKFFRAYNKKQ
ncbi:DUF817 domain-containing protein [Chryseotalea sanaruensis]|uniref:DUF817 domain-containing protein n=1 Tax=Chryseotalea sanaruensis TaxID=2482724 RepID=A0A401U5E3_9BACT|nr:DUF817 domain-containing protein [Chryseotalea sanaruensis]GCC50099.1 DUF817 domain-containing protein [Chryseotalea sanaruensis]